MERFKLDYYTDRDHYWEHRTMISLSILVRYKNCFGQDKHTYKKVAVANKDVLDNHGVINNADCLKYLLNKFKKDRESSKLLRNIKRKNKKIK